MAQRPQTTIMNLLAFGRDIRLGASLLPPESVRALRATQSGLMDDGRLGEVATVSLPWARDSATIPGAVSTGANQIAFPMPQGAIIRHVALSARVGPSGGPFAIQITGGDEAQHFSIPAGLTESPSGATIPIPAGGWARVNVTAANGAEDVTVSLHYSAGSTGV